MYILEYVHVYPPRPPGPHPWLMTGTYAFQSRRLRTSNNLELNHMQAYVSVNTVGISVVGASKTTHTKIPKIK